MASLALVSPNGTHHTLYRNVGASPLAMTQSILAPRKGELSSAGSNSGPGCLSDVGALWAGVFRPRCPVFSCLRNKRLSFGMNDPFSFRLGADIAYKSWKERCEGWCHDGFTT